ncbi:MAG: relaxase/mobilization nuclease domain-containing protein, partial [Acetobacter sp.]|nr:relaxase/mobilization nuclease domain-containing protein [Acetobacter sp.]
KKTYQREPLGFKVDTRALYARYQREKQEAKERKAQEFHTLLKEYGVELQQKGNGFIFKSGDGVCVKASTVDRSFSKGALEKRFGVFAPSKEGLGSEKRPIRESLLALRWTPVRCMRVISVRSKTPKREKRKSFRGCLESKSSAFSRLKTVRH